MELLELHNITKHYPGVVALNDVSISFRQGEVHALVGENGAGKSTFIKTISGRGLSRRNLSHEQVLSCGAIFQGVF